MLADLLKDNLARSLAATFVSEEQVEGMVRPALERYGLSPEEVDELVAEARANVRKWKQSSSVDVLGLLSSGSAGVLHALGIPTRGELDDLKRQLDELNTRLGEGEAPPKDKKKSAPRAKRA
ncbi:MAG: hypothetical protein IPK07_29710 [Deltaproteobacteria bacterium]|jgi:hypothetical protein|nr:hypothetical protein [Deltaproteobacteria bacterium]